MRGPVIAHMVFGTLLLLPSVHCDRHSSEEVVFRSGPFKIVGELRLPEGGGPHPVVVFVHGDGPNNRTSGVTYPPIMRRMLRAGYATLAWDKPGTGESTGRIDGSRLGEQRAQIVLDAVEFLEQRPEIDSDRIGLWGISQAGYVMPRVLERSDEIAFMIAVSCPGGPGVEQGIYLLAAQMVCAGHPVEDAVQLERQIRSFTLAESYEEYVRFKAPLVETPAFQALARFGQRVEITTQEQWHPADPRQGAEAYRAALREAGHPLSRVELIPGTDHNILLSETGCIAERENRSRAGWKNYPQEYLDLIEEWLTALRPASGRS